MKNAMYPAHASSSGENTFDDGHEKIQLFADLMWQARGGGDVHLQTRGSSIRWEVLIAVARSPGARMNYATLEASIGRPHRTLQYIIRDLEAIGLVELRRAQNDRRRMVIALTQQGRETFTDYIERIEDMMRKLTSAGYGLPHSMHMPCDVAGNDRMRP